jgi:formylglycine-generating enzyme required for sulfatase activity
MARFPISQAQWAAVAALPLIEREIAARPGTYEARGLWERYGQPGALAVDSVSWFDCGEWLARLNRWIAQEWATQGSNAAAPQLALPSESCWEVACRAGGSTPFHCGDTLDPSWANYDANSTYGRGRKGEYRQRPTTIGAFGPVNRWGLAEMHGQLWEWCGDRWHPNPVGGGWPKEGGAWEEPDAALEGLLEQEYRLRRGGSWIEAPRNCRAAYRNGYRPGLASTLVGVRPCCLLPPGSLLDPLGP